MGNPLVAQGLLLVIDIRDTSVLEVVIGPWSRATSRLKLIK